MCSEKKRLANQRNAQKSTGPKTEEGKAKSRRNALKHGYSGSGVVVVTEDEKKVAERVEQWRNRLAPADPLEDWLVAQAALGAVRLERLAETELAEVDDRRKKAARRWDALQRTRVRGCLKLMAVEPAAALRDLTRFSAGCAWLIDQWHVLAKALKAEGQCGEELASAALRLLGSDPDLLDADAGETACKALRQKARDLRRRRERATRAHDARRPPADAARREVAANPKAKAKTKASAAETAFRYLMRVETSRLERMRQALWARQDRPERERAKVLAQVDTTSRGQRMSRYNASNELSVHRNLNQLVRIRKVEPDYQTASRWEKTGKKVGRVWDGTNWMPWEVYQAQLRGEPIGPADAETQEIILPPRPQPPAEDQAPEAVPVSVPAPTEVRRDEVPQDAATSAQNEPKCEQPSDDGEPTSGRSPEAPGSLPMLEPGGVWSPWTQPGPGDGFAARAAG